jgi:hypothetical protein
MNKPIKIYFKLLKKKMNYSKATDTIGVLHKNGEVKCSPFIVAFENSSKSKEKQEVEIFINEKKLNLTMYLQYDQNRPLFKDVEEEIEKKEKNFREKLDSEVLPYNVLIPDSKEMVHQKIIKGKRSQQIQGRKKPHEI